MKPAKSTTAMTARSGVVSGSQKKARTGLEAGATTVHHSAVSGSKMMETAGGSATISFQRKSKK